MTSLLFDSHALLRFLQKEQGSDVILALLTAAKREASSCFLSVINFGEILYITERKFGPEARMRVFIAVHQLGINIQPCPNTLVYAAAELKAAYAMSYADAFAVAAAIEQSATLVTGDAEFRQVEHLVKIEWV